MDVLDQKEIMYLYLCGGCTKYNEIKIEGKITCDLTQMFGYKHFEVIDLSDAEFIVEDKEENICLGYSHCGPVYSSRICTRHYDYLEMFVEDIVTDKIILPSYIKRKHMNRIKNNKNIKEVVVADECSLFSMKDGDVYNKKGTILVFSNKR
jgi:hypothetical protein